jgi:hypothetical protein
MDSVHWKLIEDISPLCQEFADVLYAFVDLHLVAFSRQTTVATEHLVKLRVSLNDIVDEMSQLFVGSLQELIAHPDAIAEWVRDRQRKLKELREDGGSPGDRGGDPMAASINKVARQSAQHKSIATPSIAVDGCAASAGPSGNETPEALAIRSGGETGDGPLEDPADAEDDSAVDLAEMSLSNEDIHSLEALVFGIQAIATEVAVLQKVLLEMQSAEQIVSEIQI